MTNDAEPEGCAVNGSAIVGLSAHLCRQTRQIRRKTLRWRWHGVETKKLREFSQLFDDGVRPLTLRCVRRAQRPRRTLGGQRTRAPTYTPSTKMKGLCCPVLEAYSLGLITFHGRGRESGRSDVVGRRQEGYAPGGVSLSFLCITDDVRLRVRRSGSLLRLRPDSKSWRAAEKRNGLRATCAGLFTGLAARGVEDMEEPYEEEAV